MSAYSDLLAEILTIMTGVSNIGNVYDYQRFTSNMSTYLDLFKVSIGGRDMIRGWTITSPSMKQERFADQGKHRRKVAFKIRGWQGFEDSGGNVSEKTFRTLCESVIDTLDANPHLNAKAHNAEPAQLTSFEVVKFGNVLCHRVEIDIVYTVYKQITYS